MKRLAWLVCLGLMLAVPAVAQVRAPVPMLALVEPAWTVAMKTESQDCISHQGVHYVLDKSASTVKAYAQDTGRYLATVARPGLCPVQVQNPTAMALVGTELFVCDGDTPRIQVYSIETKSWVKDWRFPGDVPIDVSCEGESNQAELCIVMKSGASGTYRPVTGHLAWTPAPTLAQFTGR